MKIISQIDFSEKRLTKFRWRCHFCDDGDAPMDRYLADDLLNNGRKIMAEYLSFVDVLNMREIEWLRRREALMSKCAEERKIGIIIGREKGRISVLLESARRKRVRGLDDATIAEHLDISEYELGRILSTAAVEPTFG